MAHQLVLEVYSLTELLPERERFGLQAQLRRAAISVPTNIVEGCARGTNREYLQFLTIASGSAAEVRYLLRVSVELGLIGPADADRCLTLSDAVARSMLRLCAGAATFSRRSPTTS